MSRLHRMWLLVGLSVVLGCLVLPPPQTIEAAPVACSGPIIGFGRQRWCGYFRNGGNDSGQDVRIGGVPAAVNTVQELIDLVQGDLNSGNAHRITGAQFIIQTMRGRGPGAPQSVSNAEFNDWVARVKSYADSSENGASSFGENGRIDWGVWQHLPCGTVNTYYQPTLNDVAPFHDSASNSNCEVPAHNDQFIVVRDLVGSVVYRIRRLCMNPIGVINGLKQPLPDNYNLVPSVTTTVDGNPVSGGAEAGQTIHFGYAINNTGSDASPAATGCTIYTNVHAGYFAEPPVPTGSGGPGPGTGCPRAFTPGSTALGSGEDVIAAANQTVCRSLFVNPASPTVGSRGDEACVHVVSKPYFKVYGGDVSAGNGQSTAAGICASNLDAAIIGWNRGGSAGYAGAGAQFAAMALGAIYETASSGGSGLAPSGLAFANTAASGSTYGGAFGSLSCIRDYYAARPASPLSFTTIAAATQSGAYAMSGPGPFVISGPVPNKRVTLFVQGDVLISGDITYPASWTANDSPLFELVVEGNIYIRNNVSRIDGLYIAQRSGASGGTIYTCATAAVPLVPGPGLNGTCGNKLTINGAFIANDVQFLRTRGTRQQAAANEPSSSNNIAEVFNFSPALWMAQPVGLPTSLQYDSITGLPPIL